MKTIVLYEKVGSAAISYRQASLIYSLIKDDIINGNMVELDFKDIEATTVGFINGSISYLLKDVSIDDLVKRIKLTNISDYTRYLINKSIDNARDKMGCK